ncbi:[citrate (pro-3S)-lyase] ligase [Aliivibrio kagoshimensis]|uniref:[citrate (pro-3S)-lyase] ligase n=1 Tax=Aliivibrio kagoshimensis TaxID=2910230 RepID=UPI003D13EC40
MYNVYQFEHIDVKNNHKMSALKRFLSSMSLDIDVDVESFIAVKDQGNIVGCGGIAGNTFKSIAIHGEYQGQGVSAMLLTELVTYAYELGRYNLFIYTTPNNYELFHHAGFHQIAEVPGRVVLLENSQNRLKEHCHQLSKLRKPGSVVGSIVMNANPFTLGHLYLIECAAKQSDWLHLFVVQEEQALFTYQDRFNMISAGIADIPNVTIHHGSDYIISRATFPSYFIKDKGIINYCHTAIDLQLFRNHIAPALGITHRYVGTEFICIVTRNYNQQMDKLLAVASPQFPPIILKVIQRKEIDQQPISASLVRKLLELERWDDIRALVPTTTLDYLHELETAGRDLKRVKKA